MTQRAEGICVLENGHAKSYQLCGVGGTGGGFVYRVSVTYVFNVLLLCIHFKLRQALTLLFSVFVLRFYKGKIYLNIENKINKEESFGF